MASLAPALRKKLEDAVKEARDVAEAGARAALEQLAVHAAEPFAHLGPEDRKLRNRLRARARQLGDGRDTRTGAHQIDHLVVECAYEHWHRMLFARFLAENGVLMANSEALGIENTPVTLEECEELAADEGATNGWELAGRYASKMLPQIFRPDAPVLAVHLPPERQRRLEQILAELSPETFKASDALGWVYQFWQAKKKDEVNASGVKIGADELPSVTQLFTEPYMVEFLLHNTLGAWWVGRHGRDSLPVEMPYLRFLDDGTPAAGTFDGWPKTAAELKVLDPCCGSGHFLGGAFEILVRFRMVEEALSPADACAAVLSDNLHGLEVDERCTQIAAFALALAAWKLPDAGGYRVLPDMHIACSGLAPRARKSEWLALAGDDLRLRNGMERLYGLFQDAPVLGSLIAPSAVGLSGEQRELGVARLDELQPLLRAAIEGEETRRDPDGVELGVAAKGIVAAARLLENDYSLVLTNPPYRARRDIAEALNEFSDTHHRDARGNLATVFLSRMLDFLGAAGTVAAVLPQHWLFQKNYHKLRKHLLTEYRWNLLAVLGEGGFESAQAAGAFTALLVLSSADNANNPLFNAINAAEPRAASEKAIQLRLASPVVLDQVSMLENPDARVVLESLGDEALLSRYAIAPQGLKTGDDARYRRLFWEMSSVCGKWRYLQSTVRARCYSGGLESTVDWSNDGAHLARRQGLEAFGRQGVAVSQMRSLPCALYHGHAFDGNVAPIVPTRPEHRAAVWAFVSSDEYHDAVRRIDQNPYVTNATLLKVPFDLEHWQKIAAERYPDGLPEPYSEDPTQWIFKGSVRSSNEVLEVAVARLLGYRWPEHAEDGLDKLIDDDGIVCLPSVRGEEPAANRLLALLAAAFRTDWTTSRRDALLAAVGAKGKGLDWWLQNKFFEQHCQLFQHRPFIWHIWDGIKKDGFGALVNYHKLDRKLLETLTYTYLGDWIRRQQDDAARKVDGASERLDAARRLQQSLELILEGEKPHDIFVRWKPLHEQPIGWEPDLNDGVRVNIRPFMSVPDVDKKGAGVLRYKPNIHWKKDRGTDPDDAPWFELGPSYGEPKGARINDHHLSLAEKRAARARRSNQ